MTRPTAPSPSPLRDFTATPRILLLSLLGVVLGIAGAVLAWLLLHLIYVATNLFYYQRLDWNFASPALNHLGWFAALVPIAGGLIIGVMARFGSDKIRGHGMPEAIEAILINGARVSPRVAIFKPLSAAVAIGSGGPFGAEGPIIMTAGSVGSLLGQLFRLTDAERTTMLVAGAAAGMAGVFSTPLSAVLLAVELLLFEWRPRSFVPVAVAATVAGVLRRFFLSADPLFPMQPFTHPVQPSALVAALALGLVAGILAIALSRAVYASEDLFENHLPIHWMWWPAIGSVVVGLGGLIFPRALGTGYDVIASLVSGDSALNLILGVLIVKSIIWSFSLGSGTSGGILAPLLMIGGALGALFAPVLPTLQPGAWPLVAMAAVLSGAIGCPLTSAVLAMELTHNYGLLLPILGGSITAHACTVLLQKRSILTERISRRGHHLSREYGVDPLETMSVAEIMRTAIVALPAASTVADARAWLATRHTQTVRRGQRLYPLVDAEGRLSGVITRRELEVIAASNTSPETLIPSLAPCIAHPAMTLRELAEAMAAAQFTAMPVADPASGKLLGLVALEDILQARTRSYQRETRMERVRAFRLPLMRMGAARE